jgi:predicted dehydrogenase/threonine dehydrogenase-like Zn-dependent dehydrogenase
MKQILQNMKDGKTTVEEVPVPGLRPGMALVRTTASLLSAGTERMLVEFAGKNLIGKAASRPDLVRQVIAKAQREGILPTLEAALNRLDQPMPLGYSSAGVIESIGHGLEGVQAGDRVACAGGGFAVHAEYAVVPKNLLVRLPDNVDFESAAFTTLGAIALQGFRLAAPQLGESVCVIGLGLLGLLSAQIARAAGCRVFGIDLSAERVKLVESMGFRASTREACLELVAGITAGHGFDHVLICADTTSSDPVELAGVVARDRGTVVAVGAVGLQIPRKLYYDKELDFKISRSYGPGRYDLRYEEQGIDYPIGYVRWTEGRNLEAFVDLLAKGLVDVRPLISHRIPIEKAAHAYDLITGKTSEPFLGVLITYPQAEKPEKADKRVELRRAPSSTTEKIKVGVLGAGNYAQAVFLPVIKKTGGAELIGIATSAGLTAKNAGQKYGFQFASSTEEDVLANDEINTVVLLTRHNHHARQAGEALHRGKSVYCEKPLALNREELDKLSEIMEKPENPLLTVGFNRRFAPMAKTLRGFFAHRAEPAWVHYRVNAGALPASHWLNDPAQGGGRIIGEGCHFIDFLTFLIGEMPVFVQAIPLVENGRVSQEDVTLTFRYPDGSVGMVSYLSNGNKNFPKERIEVFSGGRIAVLDDFRSLELVTESGRKTMRSNWRQDKGHAAAWAAFLEAVKQGNPPPIPYPDLISTTLASFAALESLASGKEIAL